ncbi:ABC transporter permease [Streptomyces sp. NPDC045431]|uniref:ABC transporter permease n=1 Tax=Streptomyces sp. NPDC045431 TaxID=3155613 RepID=UPI0033DFF35C
MKSTSPKRRGSWADVWLVYRREIDSRLASKGYFVGTLVMVLAIFGLVVGLDYANSPKTETVAVCGAPAERFGTPPAGIRVRSCAQLSEAKARTIDKKVGAAVAVSGGKATVFVRGDSPEQARTGAVALAESWATARGYDEQHVDVDRLERTVAQAGPHVETVGAGAGSTVQVGTAVSMMIILFMQIIGQGSLVAQGVVEEKSTRIVEVLLSTLTPLRLMTGKVAGIGTAAVVQILVLVAAVAGARVVVSSQADALPGTTALASAALWFLLSFALFSCLFAAAGSLVSRPEDLQSVLMPVMVMAMAPVGVAAGAAGNLSAGWVQVVQYIPPFSGLLMPLQAAVGGVSLVQQLAAGALMLAATAACMTLAARIYRNSILRIGTTVRWRQALAA